MNEKLQRLAELEGFDDIDDLINHASVDSVVPAICINQGCEYTTEMEPDQDKGWCESCQTNSVQSCLVLLGII